MMDRQVQLGQRVSEMTGPVETRVAQALLDLVASAGKAEGQGASIPLALTRQEIADLAGTTVETAIRIMSRWGKEGLVLTEGDGFVIPDVGAPARPPRLKPARRWARTGAGGRIRSCGHPAGEGALSRS